MSCTSYLLAIDGSAESRSAAYLTWELANQTGSRVVAQHVIDAPGLWRFLSYDRGGFIGSGVYMEAREQVTEALNSIAEALMLSYTSQMQGQALDFETCIDEGDPATEIARRASQHDLVILGFNTRQSNAQRPKLFEKLAEICPCPILVVRNTGKPWSKMQVCLTNEIADQESVSQIYQMGASLGLPIDVNVDSSVKQTKSEYFTMGGWSPALGVRAIVPVNLKDAVAAAPTDELLVISSEVVCGPHAIRNRTRVRDFLEQSDRHALLLWRNRPTASVKQKLAS